MIMVELQLTALMAEQEKERHACGLFSWVSFQSHLHGEEEKGKTRRVERERDVKLRVRVFRNVSPIRCRSGNSTLMRIIRMNFLGNHGRYAFLRGERIFSFNGFHAPLGLVCQDDLILSNELLTDTLSFKAQMSQIILQQNDKLTSTSCFFSKLKIHWNPTFARVLFLMMMRKKHNKLFTNN